MRAVPNGHAAPENPEEIFPFVCGHKEEPFMAELIYLDNAATSYPKPDSVHDAVRDFYSKYGVNPGRSGCDLGISAEQMIHGTRKDLSALFNKSMIDAGKPRDPNRLVFTMNATMSQRKGSR